LVGALRDLPLRPSYRSDEQDLVRDFYVPCLSASTLYQRAVGFFASSALAVAAKGLHVFIRGGGRMELVASPVLSQEDIEAIEAGYKDRRLVETAAVGRVLSEPRFDRLAQRRLALLAWLIAVGRLDVKIVVHRSAKQYGLYHEKLGLFSDGQDFVAFTGSPNESATGLVANFECIDVFCSWRAEDRDRAETKAAQFARLWEDRTPSLSVYPFPDAARQLLLRLRPATMPEHDPEEPEEEQGVVVAEGPQLPPGLALRPYQQEAIDNWYRAKGRGTLKMATGSGKTITALAAAARLYRDIGLQGLVIVVPFRHLVTQWARECEAFGLQPIRCYESRREWTRALEAALSDLVIAKTCDFVCAIVTNATFASEHFQQVLRYFPKKTLIIGDEAHNLGADRLVRALPEQIGLRLGLSATPERWFDDEGTEDLFAYFGPVIKPEFTLRDALRSGALVPYEYHPIFVELTEDEAEEYQELSRKIGKAMVRDPEGQMESSPQLEALLFRRARLLGSAQNKLVALREAMIDRLETTHTLFYCGDGQVEEETSGETMRHIEAVARLLGYELGFRVETYTAATPLDERTDLAQRFDSGALQGLVAIRCLDEGVDIPSTRTAFIMASSTNPRQFIQRRGRVLRRAAGKDRATIFDFIIAPPGSGAEEFETERRLLERELRRYVEFADLALNAGEARGQITALQQRYNLLNL
jgi:DNA phosphorothioation system restriction enzyme